MLFNPESNTYLSSRVQSTLHTKRPTTIRFPFSSSLLLFTNLHKCIRSPGICRYQHTGRRTHRWILPHCTMSDCCTCWHMYSYVDIGHINWMLRTETPLAFQLCIRLASILLCSFGSNLMWFQYSYLTAVLAVFASFCCSFQMIDQIKL
jgi:hypothetical protein